MTSGKPQTALEKALSNRWKHNKEMEEEKKKIEEEAEEQEEMNDELLELLTAAKKSERRIAEVKLNEKIPPLKVYVDLTGEQEDYIAAITDAALKSKKNQIPDFAAAIEAAIKLAASMVVPEDGRIWHKESTWRTFFQSTDMAALIETLEPMLEPYRDACKKMAKFRRKQ